MSTLPPEDRPDRPKSRVRHRSLLTPPLVDPGVYDENYYLNWCAGYEEWESSGGARPAALYEGSLAKAGLKPGDVLVDLGTGRAELLAVAVARGASRAIGIEYSLSALALGKRTLEANATGPRAIIMAADSRWLPLPDSVADLVTMLDIVEHLTPTELHQALAEARRVLKPGGRLFAHTTPTRTIYEVTYRIQRLAVPGRRKRWPADPRVELEHIMHVNEQTRTSLTRSLRKAGFDTVRVKRGEWIHDRFVPEERARRLYHRLARHRLTAWLGVSDLWAEAS